MTAQITEPTAQPAAYGPERWTRTTLADQRQALSALDRIFGLHPNLPAMHIALHYVSPESVDVQAQSWPALEAWRVALNVAPSEVLPGNCAEERAHLQFTTMVDGVPVRVWMMGDLAQDVDETSSAVSA